MADIPGLGTVTVDVRPNLTGFTAAVRKAQYAIDLYAFAKWCEDNGHLTSGIHLDTLVDRYISTIESGEGADNPPN